MGPRYGRRALLVVTGATAAVCSVCVNPVSAGPVPQPLSGSWSGSNGYNRIQDPGRRCADGGSGQYRHVSIEAPLATSPNAVISANLPGVIRGSFDVHHDGDELVGSPVSPAANQAFLQGTESHVTISNQRGSVQLRLQAGTCTAPTLAYDGTTASGTGTWTIDPNSTTGSYHPLPANPSTGSGTFTLSLGVAPGADNPWTLSLAGNISVPQPSLKVEVAGTFWGNLGVDYATRRVTVTYRITNMGPGDTFNPVLTKAAPATSGVTTMAGQIPQALPDLAHGESTLVNVRYQLGLFQPCSKVILGCNFKSTIAVSMPDVLDKATSPPPQVLLASKAPTLPPPIS
ncbi:MAG: hypothetical protein QOH89_2892 [Pseudonocardiales bacterium]|nr:hypothetical protein [Pseudonocardiales bacterium]MDT4940055.1 hypothetical protein [Pseudonocardiales bacterium]